MNNLAVGKVKRLSLVEQTLELLRDSIISGALPPGTRLLEVDLAQELGISRGTLREALRMLENEGLVESFPGRGSYVARLSERDIREVYSLRSLLEKEAVRLAIDNVTQEDVRQLQGILDRMIAAADRGDAAEVNAYDLEFHQTIWAIAGHQRLQEVLEGFISQVRMYLTVNTQLYEDLAAGIADHVHIMEAIRNRDRTLAATNMGQHLDDAAELVTEFAREHGRDEQER